MLRYVMDYTERFGDGLARVWVDGYRRNDEAIWQLWARTALRKAARCGSCGAAIKTKDAAYRPMMNGRNRMDRICAPCIEKYPLVEDATAPDAGATERRNE
jgi:hypothetical protein